LLEKIIKAREEMICQHEPRTPYSDAVQGRQDDYSYTEQQRFLRTVFSKGAALQSKPGTSSSVQNSSPSALRRTKRSRRVVTASSPHAAPACPTPRPEGSPAVRSASVLPQEGPLPEMSFGKGARFGQRSRKGRKRRGPDSSPETFF
jgi:hypothetical protein